MKTQRVELEVAEGFIPPRSQMGRSFDSLAEDGTKLLLEKLESYLNERNASRELEA